MAQLGAPRYSLAGQSCVSRPECAHDHPDAPLMYAITCAFGDYEALDRFLKGIFPPYPEGMLSGGDPGWIWYHEKSEDGSDVVVVEIDDIISPPDGMWNEYSPAKIRYEIRAALNNFALQHPARLPHVAHVIEEFGLGDAMDYPGCTPIPTWDGTMPTRRILNS